MVLTLILAQILNWVKILLFLEWTIIYRCILVIRKTYLSEGECPTEGLDDTKITSEAKYSIKFRISRRKFFLSVHYDVHFFC